MVRPRSVIGGLLRSTREFRAALRLVFFEFLLCVEISATSQAKADGGSSLRVPEHVFGSRAFLGNESCVAIISSSPSSLIVLTLPCPSTTVRIVNQAPAIA